LGLAGPAVLGAAITGSALAPLAVLAAGKARLRAMPTSVEPGKLVATAAR
jgi:hypothetical protein